ncbi:hypothetical protein A4A49_53396 [Nicotiana attenuata]|uniref:Uncharacterized protein n=1 Tax=Nicotiana attenuata TaxID=49451 RepID=A0A1J6IYB3_NICAT|nr:hypothetical protein A4A49_53396 [Nicotiana attenuata]
MKRYSRYLLTSTPNLAIDEWCCRKEMRIILKMFRNMAMTQRRNCCRKTSLALKGPRVQLRRKRNHPYVITSSFFCFSSLNL